MAKNSTIGRYASGKVKDFGLKSALDENGEPTEGFEKALSTVLAVQRPLVLKLSLIHISEPTRPY